MKNIIIDWSTRKTMPILGMLHLQNTAHRMLSKYDVDALQAYILSHGVSDKPGNNKNKLRDYLVHELVDIHNFLIPFYN